MPDLAGLTLPQMVLFVLVLFRLSGIMIYAPFWGAKNFPIQLKGLVALLFASLLWGVIPPPAGELPLDWPGLLMACVLELGLGLAMGLVAQMTFGGLHLAGQIMGMQMGFSIANVVDPVANAQVSVIGSFLQMFGMVLFLAAGGHLVALVLVAKSFVVVPVLGVKYSPEVTGFLVCSFGGMLEQAVVLASPVVVSVLMVLIGMGFIARTVPQVNIFVLGFPLQIGVGLITLLVSVPFLGAILVGMFARMNEDVGQLIALLSQG